MANKIRSLPMAQYSLLTALALILGWVEHMIPVSRAAPGIKLGLANIAVVIALYLLGRKAAAIVSILKPLLSAALFAGLSGLIFSLSGAAASLCVMLILHRTDLSRRNRISAVGVSAAGGAAHVAAQVCAAMILTGTFALWRMLPLLLVCGGAAGAVNGGLSIAVIKRIKTLYLS